MKVSFKLVSGNYEKMLEKDHDRIARTATETFRKVGADINEKVRAKAKNKYKIKVKVYPESGVSGSPSIVVTETAPFGGKSHDGPIVGHPLLWLPIEENVGKGMSPKKFIAQGGVLRGGRQGSKPILFGMRGGGGGARGGRGHGHSGEVWLPMFVGVSQVRRPKVVDVAGAIIDDILGSDEIAQIYSSIWEQNG